MMSATSAARLIARGNSLARDTHTGTQTVAGLDSIKDGARRCSLRIAQACIASLEFAQAC